MENETKHLVLTLHYKLFGIKFLLKYYYNYIYILYIYILTLKVIYYMEYLDNQNVI